MAKKSKKIVTEEKALEASSELEEKSISEEDLETSGLTELLDKGKDQGFFNLPRHQLNVTRGYL